MSKPPETWTQDGPLGRERWHVEFHGFEVDVFVTDGSDLTVTGTVGDVNGPGRLRDFARALDRAADALEAAAEPEPKHWLGPTGICGLCGEPWPHPAEPRETCLAHLQPEPCPTCASYRAAGL